MASKVEAEVEVKSPADNFWGALRDSTALFPRIFPEQYKSIETVEGDGKSAGTIRLLKYAEGAPIVTFAKERVEVADDGNKLVSYSVIDGELVSFYKPFKVTLQVVPKSDGGLVKWWLEYDKVNEEVPQPDFILGTAVKTFKDLDAYLLQK
ncbi:MLP-like protein 423 [Elaeis guineensis]|uniref:MLP-like protein 423 n=1 Tax=Elaeis guineensis var. tenera TaxID=51953 RepID=A0A6I9QQ86_ELAGV|nr:MLP-like protein 423 [Elaeis guineensis]